MELRELSRGRTSAGYNSTEFAHRELSRELAELPSSSRPPGGLEMYHKTGVKQILSQSLRNGKWMTQETIG